jgi:hypothetical protein
MKDEGALVNRYVAETITAAESKVAEQREESIIREVILRYLDRQVGKLKRKSQSQREELTTMWSRLYRNHVIMAFPSYDTVANAWAPQADINWFVGSSHDSKFVRFSRRCTTEEEAVTCALRRSEVWIDTRLRRLSRAILPERDRGGRQDRSGEKLFGQTDSQAACSISIGNRTGARKNIDVLSVQVRVRPERLKTQRRGLAEKLRGIDQAAQPRSRVLT